MVRQALVVKEHSAVKERLLALVPHMDWVSKLFQYLEEVSALGRSGDKPLQLRFYQGALDSSKPGSLATRMFVVSASKELRSKPSSFRGIRSSTTMYLSLERMVLGVRAERSDGVIGADLDLPRRISQGMVDASRFGKPLVSRLSILVSIRLAMFFRVYYCLAL